jgi:hypothetical protein
LPTKIVEGRATAMLPELMHQRLGEMGMDFSVLFPTIPGLLVNHPLHEPELRQAGCRAYNKYSADSFRGYTDRLCPVASIPMHPAWWRKGCQRRRPAGRHLGRARGGVCQPTD